MSPCHHFNLEEFAERCGSSRYKTCLIDCLSWWRSYGDGTGEVRELYYGGLFYLQNQEINAISFERYQRTVMNCFMRLGCYLGQCFVWKVQQQSIGQLNYFQKPVRFIRVYTFWIWQLAYFSFIFVWTSDWRYAWCVAFNSISRNNRTINYNELCKQIWRPIWGVEAFPENLFAKSSFEVSSNYLNPIMEVRWV